jgi:hypothetical protein
MPNFDVSQCDRGFCNVTVLLMPTYNEILPAFDVPSRIVQPMPQSTGISPTQRYGD